MVLILLFLIAASKSIDQSLSLLDGRNTLNDLKLKRHPRITLTSSSRPSAWCLSLFIILFRLIGSDLITGRNKTWQANAGACNRHLQILGEFKKVHCLEVLLLSVQLKPDFLLVEKLWPIVRTSLTLNPKLLSLLSALQIRQFRKNCGSWHKTETLLELRKLKNRKLPHALVASPLSWKGHKQITCTCCQSTPRADHAAHREGWRWPLSPLTASSRTTWRMFNRRRSVDAWEGCFWARQLGRLASHSGLASHPRTHLQSHW